MINKWFIIKTICNIISSKIILKQNNKIKQEFQNFKDVLILYKIYYYLNSHIFENEKYKK